jgi:hypothetical protein
MRERETEDGSHQGNGGHGADYPSPLPEPARGCRWPLPLRPAAARAGRAGRYRTGAGTVMNA